MKYTIKVVTVDGSKLTWYADSEKLKDDMVKNIMLSDGYVENTNDYGVLYVNRKHIVAVEVHNN